MKKSLLFLFLLFSITAIAQNIRVYNQYVDTEDVVAYAKTFKDFNEEFKRKSGAIGLQRVQFLNEVTHRVIITGDPSNWGVENPADQVDRDNYFNTVSHYRSKSDGSYTAKSLYWKAGDRVKNNTGQQWLIKVDNPAKYLAAFTKFAKAVEPMIGTRMMGLGAINMGDVDGATHYTVFYGENLNDLDVILEKVRATKAYKEFSATRGDQEIIKSFMVQDLLRF